MFLFNKTNKETNPKTPKPTNPKQTKPRNQLNKRSKNFLEVTTKCCHQWQLFFPLLSTLKQDNHLCSMKFLVFSIKFLNKKWYFLIYYYIQPVWFSALSVWLFLSQNFVRFSKNKVISVLILRKFYIYVTCFKNLEKLFSIPSIRFSNLIINAHIYLCHCL